MGQTSCAVFVLIQFTEQTHFEIKNHSNHPNRQVLLSFILFCYNVSRLYYHFLPIALRGRKFSIHIEWGESAVTFQSHGQQWYCCYAYNNNHGETVGWPGSWFTAGYSLFNCVQRWYISESTTGCLHSVKPEKISVFSEVDIVYISFFFISCSNTCKTTLIYSNVKGNNFYRILINVEQSPIQLF